MLSIQIYPLNACKLDWEENFFNFNVESIAFRIKILINVTSILIFSDSHMYNSNMKIGKYLYQTHAIKWLQQDSNPQPLNW